MIIQIPRGTSIVLRFDNPGAADFDLGQTITLLAGSEPAAPVAAIAPSSAPRTSGARRRTMLVCGAAGMLVAGTGALLLQSPRAEPTLFQPRATAWNERAPIMPTPMPLPHQMQAELDRAPTVVPPDAGPTREPEPEPVRPAGAPAGNPFGLE